MDRLWIAVVPHEQFLFNTVNLLVVVVDNYDLFTCPEVENAFSELAQKLQWELFERILLKET